MPIAQFRLTFAYLIRRQMPMAQMWYRAIRWKRSRVVYAAGGALPEGGKTAIAGAGQKTESARTACLPR
jgi:hypothetical protein